jgi:hypothetical protein
MAHLWELSDEQFKAIRALQRREVSPPIVDVVWSALVALGMVWIDHSSEPAVARLTAVGRNYDAS